MRASRKPVIPELVLQIRPFLPDDAQVWLVGGAVRDQLLGRACRDFDLVLADRARRAGRAVANALGGDYYDLDAERDIGRVLTVGDGDQRVTLDFSRLDPDGITADLRRRDFTVNALAVQLDAPEILVDPTGGLLDLEGGLLRACGPGVLDDDPVRVLRGVRLASQLQFDIEGDTLDQIRGAAALVSGASSERVRDELYCMLGLPSAAEALRQCIQLGVLFPLMPDLERLAGLSQPGPHEFDALEHSLRVTAFLSLWVGDPSNWRDVWEGLEPYAGRVQAHLHQSLGHDRSRGQSLILAGLLHDIGKPAVAQTTDTGTVQFHGHEAVGAGMAAQIAGTLHLSRAEVSMISRVVANHMRPGQLAREASLTGRAVYRFFRATGEDGIEVCLLALADLWGQTEAPPERGRWEDRLKVVRRLLEAYFDRRQEEVSPVPLLSGDDLMAALHIQPGPVVGELLEAIRQAQAEGTIRSRADALSFAVQWQPGR